jgi:hypothetical protein
MKNLTNRFIGITAAQQAGFCPNFDSQAFDAFKKGRKIYKFSTDAKALSFIDKNGKPFAAKKENEKIIFAL